MVADSDGSNSGGGGRRLTTSDRPKGPDVGNPNNAAAEPSAMGNPPISPPQLRHEHGPLVKNPGTAKRESHKGAPKCIPEAALTAIANATSGGAPPGKRTKPDAPKFLLLLYEILHNESDRVIRWSSDGLALQILDQTVVTEQILPKYFNHTNFHSFQRQLNYFGFRKWTKSKTDICTFSHPYFRKNQPELLQFIKRKKAPRRTPSDKADVSDVTTSTATGFSTGCMPPSPASKRKLAPDKSNTMGCFDARLHSSGLASHHDGSNSERLSINVVEPAFMAPAMTNAISPVAAGGCKKKAKKNDKRSRSTVPIVVPTMIDRSENSNGVSHRLSTAPLDRYASSNTESNATLPNLDAVRHRLIRKHQSGGMMDPSSQHGTSLSHRSSSLVVSRSPERLNPESFNPTRPIVTPSSAGESSPLFSNSFSDPVDILLRIKKSRAMSHDNASMNSPLQHANDQAESLTSLQNFLLSQSLYTNRLESQLKLALEENESLRSAMDAKTREIELLKNERKVIQNENAVLVEDKNKLFEINRDLLSKLFPQ